MIPPDPSTPNPPPGGAAEVAADVAALGDSVRSLRSVMNLTLVVLIMVTTMLNFVLMYQLRSLRRQAGELLNNAHSMTKVVGEFETNSLPVLERFSVDLQKFAERNPDFAKILAPYTTEAPAPKSAGPTPAAPPRGATPPKK